MRHYRRCTAVALRYSGLFECIQRVIWRADWGFRAFVSGHSAPALLDGALQVVCSLDALSRGATFVPFYIERFETIPNFEIVRPCTTDRWRVDCTRRLGSSATLPFMLSTIFQQPHFFQPSCETHCDAKRCQICQVGDSRQPPRSHIRETEEITYPNFQFTRDHTTQTSPKSQSNDDASLLRNLISLSSDLVGGTVDAQVSFRNGCTRCVLSSSLERSTKLTMLPRCSSARFGRRQFCCNSAALRSALDALILLIQGFPTLLMLTSSTAAHCKCA